MACGAVKELDDRERWRDSGCEKPLKTAQGLVRTDDIRPEIQGRILPSWALVTNEMRFAAFH